MKLHREGYTIILIATLVLGGLQFGNWWIFKQTSLLWLYLFLSIGFLVLFGLIVQFFRIPKRACRSTPFEVVCPADGKVVVVEEVTETEYFNDKRIQVSIFMSPLNVHANYHPVSGNVVYTKYHPGQFLVAWHPKSSTENERTTVVTKHASGQEVLFRQIAGAMARRICFYAKEGQAVTAGDEFGFIKFGSRVDIFLPLNCEINVKIGDVVKSRVTKLAHLKDLV